MYCRKDNKVQVKWIWNIEVKKEITISLPYIKGEMQSLFCPSFMSVNIWCGKEVGIILSCNNSFYWFELWL